MKTNSSLYFKSFIFCVFFSFLGVNVKANFPIRIDPEKEKNAEKSAKKIQTCKKKETELSNWWVLEISKINPKNTSRKTNSTSKSQKKIQQGDLLMPFALPSFLTY